jgi:hypothetical protein
MHGEPNYQRSITGKLSEALNDSPAVLLHGPRQSGKSTLAQMICRPLGYAYLTFDDYNLLGAARSDPQGFVADLPERTILDEVQRVPEIFRAIKSSIDKDRRPGRFLLTGSANVLLVPALSESLAGRLAIVRLHPLSQSEIARSASNFLEIVFDGSIAIRKTERLGEELAERIAVGGYPPAAARNSEGRRAAWYRDYIETQIQRDVKDLAKISSLTALPRLLSYAVLQTAQLLNVSELAGPFQVSRPTIREYLTLLENIFLLDELPPWHTNRLSRLVKTPKLHINDTGIACALLGMNSAELYADRKMYGQILETFVYQELRRESSKYEDEFRFFHYRTRDGIEVDLVIEHGANKLVGIEVKASSTVRQSDFQGLRNLREYAGDQFEKGVILYDGDTSVGFGNGLFAVPIRSIWEGL